MTRPNPVSGVQKNVEPTAENVLGSFTRGTRPKRTAADGADFLGHTTSYKREMNSVEIDAKTVGNGWGPGVESERRRAVPWQ